MMPNTKALPYGRESAVRMFVVCTLALVAIASPASAKGKHISCQFTASINDGTKSGNTPLVRTLNFYLDDTHAQLVGEGGDVAQGTNLNVRTVTYSDTQIDAEISTGILADGMMFFNRVSEGRAVLSINRLAGFASYAVRLLPRGAEAGMGSCHEIVPPGAKF